MLSKYRVLELWEKYYGATLPPQQRQLFYERCEPLLQFDETTIRYSLDIASKEQDFKIVRLKQIASDFLAKKAETLREIVYDDEGIQRPQEEQLKRLEQLQEQNETLHLITRDLEHYRRFHDLPLGEGEDEYWHKWTDPKQLSDADLHRKIGPTQKYDDDL